MPDPVTPPLRAFIGPGGGYRQMRGPGGFRDDPVPLTCWECGKSARRQKDQILFARVRDGILSGGASFRHGRRRTAGGKHAADTHTREGKGACSSSVG
jgi:hypothetical protein